MDKKNITLQRIIALIVLALILGLVTMGISARSAYKSRRASEKLDTLDVYKMHEFSEFNSRAVMKAMASGNSKKLSKIMINPEGAAALIEYTDWKKADFEKAVSMGSGSLDPAPDDKGKMEISERFFVEADGVKYVLFIETSTSRWGRANDGVSAVAVTTMEHFDDLDWNWNGEPDENSVLAGELLWNKEK